MYRYFAYGSVLSRRHVDEWAVEHGVDPRLFATGTPAVLRGYELVFDVESKFWAGRVANLRESEGGSVHGVLFELPAEAKEAVLRKEGVPTGLSQEIAVTVETAGRQVDANAFVARPERRAAPSAPSAKLMTYLLEGAQERGLPQTWIDELRRHAAAAAPTTPAASTTLKIGFKR
ncbi:MAG: gamma-glutamylcyclotransferase [Myxococcales bacterium]